MGTAISAAPHHASVDDADTIPASKGGTKGHHTAEDLKAYVLDGADGAIPASYLDTDTTLAANSDTKVATQKAVKAYADALIGANDAMVFKGVIDCSANPNYPAASRGDTYRVSVAGKIGGGSGPNVEAGDLLLCLTDSTASGDHAAAGSAWTIAQANIDGAVTGPASATASRLASFSGTTGKIIQDSGVASSTDGTMAADSDAKLPTEKAVRTYTAAYVTANAKERGIKTADELGVVANGSTDDRAALQSAQTSLGDTGGELILPGNLTMLVGENGSNNYCLRYTAPINVSGQGLYSAIRPDGAIASDVNNIEVKPNAGYNFRFVRYSEFFLGNPNDGTRAGAVGMDFDGTTTGAVVANAEIDGIYIAPGADVAIKFTNNDQSNPTGQFHNSVISRSVLYKGLKLDGAGDSIFLRNVVLTGDGLGLDYRAATSAADNMAGIIVLWGVNATAYDGVAKFNRSRNAAIVHGNFEQTVSYASGKMVDFEKEVRESAKTITAATNASPGVFTSTSHGYSNGDVVYVNAMSGLSDSLLGRHFIVAGSTTNTFTLTDIFGVAINTTSLSAFVSGTVQKVTTRAGPHVAPFVGFSHFGAFSGVGLTSMLHVGSARGGAAWLNDFVDGGSGATYDIDIDDNSYGFWVGPNTTKRAAGLSVRDNGVGTRGITKDASSMLANSWVNFGSGLAPLEFVKSVDGIVHITGAIKDGLTTGGTAAALGGTLIFTLPEGFRPDAIHRLPVSVNDVSGVAFVYAAHVLVDTNGEVSVGFIPSTGGAGNQEVFFACSFRAAYGNSVIISAAQG